MFSNINTEDYNNTIQRVGLKLTGAVWDAEPPGLPAAVMFEWLAPKEDNSGNRRAYMAHLREHFVWPDGFGLFDCNEAPNLLSMEEDCFKVSGNIDVVVARQEDVNQETIRQNIRTGIELKKDNNTGTHEKQVVMQHLAASALNPFGNILTLMTDLNNRYHFYWFSGSKPGVLYRYMSKPHAAKFLLEHMFDDVDKSSEFPTDFLARGTWFTFTGTRLCTIAESLSGEQDDRDHGQGGNGQRGAGKSWDNAKRGGKSGDRGNNESGDNKNGGSNEGGATQGARVHGNMRGLDVANELDLLDFYDEDEERMALFRHLIQHCVPRMTYTPDGGGAAQNGLSEADLRSHNATIGH